MGVQLKDPAQEIKRLQRCINDLVSVVTLSAAWSGSEPSQIVPNLLDALLRLLQLDVVYARLKDPASGESIEMVRTEQSQGWMPEKLKAAIGRCFGDDSQSWSSPARKSIGGLDLSLVPLRLGLHAELGLIVAVSQRIDFPGEIEKLVLTVAANQATIGLQEARLLSQQKRLASELDERVAQRTRELEAAFEEIKHLKDRLQDENVVLREQVNQAFLFEEIVGASAALKTVLSHVSKVAATDSTVLLTGETGTGKELVARAIHKRSRRSSGAFVSVNCAAIPPSLIASELFGHEKGAFTGALTRRLGRFELAEKGTIFLDEIGELPAETQIALLRVLQEREFERVGGSQTIRVDVRVVAATNRDLEAATAAGAFRSDLFYRLNVFPIEIPPLRERKEDIPLLVEYFVSRFARKAGKSIHGINRKTLDLLLSYSWPGNIRELQNVVERSVIVCETENLSVDSNWLSGRQAGHSESRLDLSQLEAREKGMIETALRESGGRVSGPSGAAAKLGIPGSTLESKIRSLKIDKNRFKVPNP
jgi:transcriptional regulator with GAF, ATPase, and Fis domain